MEEFYEITSKRKSEVKLEQQRRKKILKFQKSLHLPKNYTQEQLDIAVINYAKLHADCDTSLKGAKLTDRQYNSSKFMQELYKADTETTIFYPPTLTLQKDIDFMVKYFTWFNCGWLYTGLDYANVIAGNHGTVEDRFAYLLKKYPQLIDFPEFTISFEQYFSENHYPINIVKAANLAIQKTNCYTQFADKVFFYYTKRLPAEFLIEQAKIFGSELIEQISPDLPIYEELIRAGVECDGFESLQFLDIQQIMANKDLVVAAYHKKGIKALANYITETLCPYTTLNGHTIYIQAYADAQKALVEDPDIAAILQVHKDEVNLQYVQKGLYTLEQPESANMGNKSGSNGQKNYYVQTKHADAKLKNADSDIIDALNM